MNHPAAIKGKADQVIDHITAWLRSGELKVGDKLPSERELAQMLGVSLLTINKAMARLEDAALLSRSAGRGTHVVSLPSPDAIAIICDICHLVNSNPSPFFDVLIEYLQETARHNGMVPHFLVGKGRTAPDFLSSLGFQSAIWNSIKGAIAMAWCEGVEETLSARGIPLVTISAKDQGNHSVIIDYDELGRMAAALFPEELPGDVHVVYNEIFDEFPWNNPVSAFSGAMRERRFDPARIRLWPVNPTRETGKVIGERFGRDGGHIFFTDENITAGFGEWLRDHTGSDDPGPGRRIVTQMSGDNALPIPETFDRLSFGTRSICREAVNLLEELLAGDFRRQASTRRFVKPVLLPRRASGGENILASSVVNASSSLLHQIKS